MKIEIDCVKLQRQLRAKADEKYKDLPFDEQIKRIHEELRQQGLWHLFEEDAEGAGPEAKQGDNDREQARK